MIKKITSTLGGLFKNKAGATSIEYGLVVVCIALAITLSLKATGLQLKCIYDSVAQIVGGGSGHACS